jgi:hypothetical protein
VVVSPTTDAEDGQTYNIQFKDGDNPLTVYGCTLDVVNGVLTVDRGYVELDGDNTNNKYSFVESGRINFDDTNLGYKKNSNIEEISKCYKRLPQTETNSAFKSLSGYGNGVFNFSNTFTPSQTIRIRDDRFTDLNTALSVIASDKPTFCYELATPITIQLTPTAVKSLLGTNNLWADSGKVLSGEYMEAL